MPKIISANLNGIRSAATKGFFNWMAKQDADFVCVQELKAQAPDMTPEFLNPAATTAISTTPRKRLFRHRRLQQDRTGPRGDRLRRARVRRRRPLRALRFRQADRDFVYCPSGSSGPERQEAKFRFMDLFLPHLQRCTPKAAKW
jgi:exodeoxyribonuclease-3